MSINPIHRAPYTNFHDLNLDWIIEVLNEFNTKLTDFVSLATIKYANPIQWNITSQYESNTVVVDSNGNAYLSVRPVPSGVSLDRTEFWTKIGNFDELWADVKRPSPPTMRDTALPRQLQELSTILCGSMGRWCVSLEQ